MCGDEMPVAVAPAPNEERAIVLYSPTDAARNLLLGPLRPDVPLRVNHDWIHELKSTMLLRETSDHRALFEELARDENSNLAMVPWVPSNSQEPSTAAAAAMAAEMMDAEDTEVSPMEVEQYGASHPASAGVGPQGESQAPYQWPQHCMVQQPLPAASYQSSPVFPLARRLPSSPLRLPVAASAPLSVLRSSPATPPPPPHLSPFLCALAPPVRGPCLLRVPPAPRPLPSGGLLPCPLSGRRRRPCRRRAPRRGVRDVTGIDRADPHHLPFSDGSFDLVFSDDPAGVSGALFPSRITADAERTVRIGGAITLAVDQHLDPAAVAVLFKRSCVVDLRDVTLDGSQALLHARALELECCQTYPKHSHSPPALLLLVRPARRPAPIPGEPVSPDIPPAPAKLLSASPNPSTLASPRLPTPKPVVTAPWGASVAARSSDSRSAQEDPLICPPETLAVSLHPVARAARRASPAPSETPCCPDLRYLGP
ncbi:hypothetical protein GUJ93_ZPchr0002g23736 [Zizania palustris]|nr:hypothetical protein GUJ93_ZPchr0002g23736 [Zizania palustris]